MVVQVKKYIVLNVEKVVIIHMSKVSKGITEYQIITLVIAVVVDLLMIDSLTKLENLLNI